MELPRVTDEHFVVRLTDVPGAGPYRTWTIRDDNHQNYHGRVHLSESPLTIVLRWRRSATAQVQSVGVFRLDLRALLKERYIRRDPSGSHADCVRLRFFRRDDGVMYIQVNSNGPAVPIGSVL